MSDTFQLRDYQQRAVEWAADKCAGLIVARAGVGKTLIASGIIAKCLSCFSGSSMRVGWVANTIEQKYQAWDALGKFPELASCVISVECAANEPDFSDCDVVIVDEVHHCRQAVTWQKIIEKCNGLLFGFTATPWTEDAEANERFRDMFGGNVYTIDRSETASNLAPARVILFDDTDPGLREEIDSEINSKFSWRSKYIQPPMSEQELWGQIAWRACIDIGIVSNRLRNERVIQLATQHASDQVLILVNQIDHGTALASAIPHACMCHSKMGIKKRRTAMDNFRTGSLKCMIATSLADEGLDLPNAGVLILVSAGRSSRLAEQRTGRVLRTFAGKDHAKIYDFSDKDIHPLMAKHSKRRQEVYRKLGYSFEGEI